MGEEKKLRISCSVPLNVNIAIGQVRYTWNELFLRLGKGGGVHNLFTLTSRCEEAPTQHFAFTWYFSFFGLLYWLSFTTGLWY